MQLFFGKIPIAGKEDAWRTLQHKTFLNAFDSREHQKIGTDTVAGFAAIVDSFVGTKGAVRTLSFVITFGSVEHCYTILFTCVWGSAHQSHYLQEFMDIVKSIEFLVEGTGL